jgi:hypothetical protein
MACKAGRANACNSVRSEIECVAGLGCVRSLREAKAIEGALSASACPAPPRQPSSEPASPTRGPSVRGHRGGSAPASRFASPSRGLSVRGHPGRHELHSYRHWQRSVQMDRSSTAPGTPSKAAIYRGEMPSQLVSVRLSVCDAVPSTTQDHERSSPMGLEHVLITHSRVPGCHSGPAPRPYYGSDPRFIAAREAYETRLRSYQLNNSDRFVKGGGARWQTSGQPDRSVQPTGPFSRR